MKKISLVVPMYNEEEMAPLFFEAVDPIVKSLSNYEFEVLTVNDGSKDQTLEVLKKLQAKYPYIVIINLSRNFGQEPAVEAGLKTATGDCVIPLDADLQDPPEVIPQLVKMWEEGYDVVNAKRSSRKSDSKFKKDSAGFYYRFLDKISPKVKIIKNVANYRLVDRKVLDIINSFKETNRVFRIEVPYAGFKVGQVEYVRPSRIKGESKYPLKAMISLALRSITALSTKPLHLSIYLTILFGFLSCLSGLSELVVFLIDRIGTLNLISPLAYWAWLIITIIVLFSAIICGLISIISIYLGVIVEESRKRPNVIIDEIIKKE